MFHSISIITIALGFWHEQSRTDRDDYVTIDFNNVQPGREHNFNKYSASATDTLDLPYDYNSVMHYSKTAFSINGLPTIITKDSNVWIGQRNALSANDIEEIRRYYKSTIAPIILTATAVIPKIAASPIILRGDWVANAIPRATPMIPTINDIKGRILAVIIIIRYNPVFMTMHANKHAADIADMRQASVINTRAKIILKHEARVVDVSWEHVNGRFEQYMDSVFAAHKRHKPKAPLDSFRSCLPLQSK
ncbi:hypothetical protein I4U23_014821 [Adineta vaga]|nr:hypothetical protein I4U23_014821 [Adineta vaga]